MKKINKKGQVTIFLIVGIIILAAFAGLMYLVSYIQKEKLIVEEKNPLTLELRPQFTFFVENCLEEVAEPGIYLLGKQGGIIYPETDFLNTENNIINYAHLNGEFLLNKEKMEEQISRFIEENLNRCIDNFSGFEELALTINTEPPKVESLILQNNIQIDLKYPIEIIKGDDEISLENFQIDFPLNLGEYINYAENISAVSGQSGLDLSYFAKFKPFINIYPFDESTTIFSIYDNVGYRGLPYGFVFAVRNENINYPPELEYIPDFVLVKGMLFEYQLKADDLNQDKLSFSSDSGLVNLSENGTLSFTPQEAGIKQVTFMVKDAAGLSSEQKVKFTIEND